MLNAVGITFEADCLIGAEDAFERWACQSNYTFLKGLAHQGILTETIVAKIVPIMIAVIILTILTIIFYKKYKQNKNKELK